MRPRTATFQVYEENDMWIVEVGDPKAAIFEIRIVADDLLDALTEMIYLWVKREGLNV